MRKYLGRSKLQIYFHYDHPAWLDRHWPQQLWYGYPAEEGCL